MAAFAGDTTATAAGVATGLGTRLGLPGFAVAIFGARQYLTDSASVSR